jgi:hypothetical protein
MLRGAFLVASAPLSRRIRLLRRQLDAISQSTPGCNLTITDLDHHALFSAVTVAVENKDGNVVTMKKTKVQKQTLMPNFEEDFEFPIRDQTQIIHIK